MVGGVVFIGLGAGVVGLGLMGLALVDLGAIRFGAIGLGVFDLGVFDLGVIGLGVIGLGVIGWGVIGWGMPGGDGAGCAQEITVFWISFHGNSAIRIKHAMTQNAAITFLVFTNWAGVRVG